MTKADSVVVFMNFPLAEQSSQESQGHFQWCRCSAEDRSDCVVERAGVRMQILADGDG